MKVEITNVANINHAMKAWTVSRPNDKDTSLRDILKLDLPVNEFINVNLVIESTIIEREIITTMRNHVMWAQTSRVQDVLAFETSEYASEFKKYYSDISQYVLEHDDRILISFGDDESISKHLSYLESLEIFDIPKKTPQYSGNDITI